MERERTQEKKALVQQQQQQQHDNTLSPQVASLVITIITLRCLSPTLVYSIYDSTEVAVQEMIDPSHRKLRINSQGGEAREGGGMNPVVKKHYEQQIKTLQNAPRDVEKLEQLLKIKRRQKDEAMHIEDTQRLVTEISAQTCIVSSEQKLLCSKLLTLAFVNKISIQCSSRFFIFLLSFAVVVQDIPSL
ncbi:MAG TPA: hypothetical protein VFH09_01865 [Nitrososphaera sp.]|nr:hypothetical protein [Nitrososphaera sp.]